MTAHPSPAVSRGASLTVAFLVGLSSIFTSCQRADVQQSRQIEALQTELDEAKRRLAPITSTLVANDAELLETVHALEKARTTIADKDKALDERDARLRDTIAELQALKKSEALIFAEIRTRQVAGHSAEALSAYYKFIKDFPDSPLAGSAASHIAEMTARPPDKADPTAGLPPDPKRRDRDFTKNFNEGYMTLPELAPVLKDKSMAQVLALCGKPNRTYNSNTEFGYDEKAISPVTGRRGTLIIGFDKGFVESLRVEYAGRKMYPARL